VTGTVGVAVRVLIPHGRPRLQRHDERGDLAANALRELGWDVRVKLCAVLDLHVQDPRGVVDLLADVLAPTA
jgi:hypothetical protein